MSLYSLNARIIQKKDQLEELSASGGLIQAPVVEEVRTGQQFLIKLHLVKNALTPTAAFPALRVGRREAINTAGETHTDPEPLTLEIFVHLAKSGQIRQGACAKCCHKVNLNENENENENEVTKRDQLPPLPPRRSSHRCLCAHPFLRPR
jgi:hypothetical protein